MIAKAITIAILFGHILFAAEVYSVKPLPGALVLIHLKLDTNDRVKAYRTGEEICLVKANDASAFCGLVSRAFAEEITLEASGNPNLSVGQTVKLFASKAEGEQGNRSPTSVDEKITETSYKYSMQGLGAGLGTGFSFLLFHLKYDFRINDHWLTGVRPSFAYDYGADTTVTALGVHAFADYFLLPHPFGYFVEGGLGFYSLTTTSGGASASALPLSLYSTFGWRGKIINSGITFGGALGLQYVGSSASQVVNGFSGILPLLVAEVCYRF